MPSLSTIYAASLLFSASFLSNIISSDAIFSSGRPVLRGSVVPRSASLSSISRPAPQVDLPNLRVAQKSTQSAIVMTGNGLDGLYGEGAYRGERPNNWRSGAPHLSKWVTTVPVADAKILVEFDPSGRMGHCKISLLSQSGVFESGVLQYRWFDPISSEGTFNMWLAIHHNPSFEDKLIAMVPQIARRRIWWDAAGKKLWLKADPTADADGNDLVVEFKRIDDLEGKDIIDEEKYLQ